MKTRKMKLIALMITLAAVTTGINAEAQRREYRSDRHDNKNDRQYHAEKRHEKREYHKPNREYRAWDDNHKSKKYHKKHRDYSYKYHRDNHRHYDRHADRHYRHHKYGMVYRKFNHAPLRLRHHHGDFYYHDGCYYRHHRGIGYVRIELPRHIIFDRLPFHCDRYRLGNHIYYRHGDLVFEHYGHGYRLAPSIGIQFSAHF